jgi:hypothetical protein
MALRNPPINQALNPRRTSILPSVLLAVGMLVALAAAAYGYVESRRTERVVILLRPVPYGQQLAAEDVGTVELPLHRPAQLAGIGDPSLVVGRWAARDVQPDDFVQPSMLLETPPEHPVFPNGRPLAANMVPLPFPVTSVGPLTDRDLLNIGFTSSDAELCRGTGETVAGDEGRAFACRFMTGVRVLYIESGTAYLELTPYQAHAIYALQASGAQLWAERYGLTSTPLPPMTRLDAGQIVLEELIAPPADTPAARE